MAGNFTVAYRASSNLTVTNLASIATSSTWVAGWTSGTIDNTSNLDETIWVSAKFALGNSATAGEIRVYVYTMLDDSNWNTSLFSAGTAGTEGTATIATTTMRDSGLYLLWSTATRADPGTDDVYPMPKRSIASALGGWMPPKCALFVTHSTGVNFAASGHQVTIAGQYGAYT
jgi:hypothetical protein